jgi:xanthine/uracil permease
MENGISNAYFFSGLATVIQSSQFHDWIGDRFQSAMGSDERGN